MNNYRKLRKIRKVYFGYEEIAKVLGISFDSARVEAGRFVKYGLIIRIKRNIYVLTELWSKLDREERFLLANILQVPSYISLMSALDYYRITTQIQQDFFESVCLRRTKEISLEGVMFNYTKINPKLYFGFVKVKDFFIATPEKAFLDALYLSLLGRYKFDKTSLDYNKFNLNNLKILAKKFPRRVQRAVKKYV